MIRTIGSLALALCLGAAAQAATTNTTLTVTASGSFAGTSITATGTGSLGSSSGSFSSTLSLTSADTSGNLNAPFTLTLSGGTLAGTLKIPTSALTAPSGSTVSGSATIDGTKSTGTYAGATGSFTLTGTAGLNTSTLALSISFSGPGTITTGSGGGPTGNAPTITDVLDAASNTADVAQGTIFVVKGTNLSAAGFKSFDVPRPTVAPDGVKITFTPAAGGAATDTLLWYEYNQSGVNQLAGIIPSTLAVGKYNVTVTNGTVSAPFSANVVARKFELFTQDSSGTGLASVQNSISSTHVDLNSFTTGNGKATTISPANPGQFIIAYGTGLGALANGDNATAPVHDFTADGVTVQAIVGGVSIPALFAGRAGYAGEDQLNFQLPGNVPTGCAVPFQISVNGQLSNTTFIAIAPDANATACVQPGFTTQQLQNFDNGGTYTVGTFSLTSFSETVQGTSVTVSNVGGAFTKFTGFQFAGAAAASLNSSTIGTCTVTRTTGNASPVVTGVGGTSLDAGSITLTGPTGSKLTNTALTETKTVTSSGTDIAYSLGIGSFGGFTLPGSVDGTIVPGTYTLNGAGGADVGKFNASVSIGSPLTVTGGLPGSVVRNSGLTLNWTGGNATDLVEIFGSSSTATTGGTTTEFICLTTAAQKTFTVPSSVLNQLPASTSGSLAVLSSVAPTSANGQFTAPLTAGGDINFGTFLALSGTGGLVSWQ